jgi:pimeloyl-ACP methyl ester carboxylesterase
MREFWFESDGARLFATEDGNGSVIVMLHGGMANHESAVPLIAPLASRYRVIAPDLRGSGKSWSGAPLTFDRLADDVEALLNHIGVDRAVVGGVSAAELRSLQAPTLLIRGNDPIHPPEVSDVYAANIPACTVLPAPTGDLAEAIGAFCDQCLD